MEESKESALGLSKEETVRQRAPQVQESLLKAELVRGRGLSSENCQAGDRSQGQWQAQERRILHLVLCEMRSTLKVWGLSGDRLRLPFKSITSAVRRTGSGIEEKKREAR